MRARLLVISDTAMARVKGEWTGYEPVVKELEYLSPHWKEIVWIGFVKNSTATVYASQIPANVRFIPLPGVGGAKWMDKLKVFLLYPWMAWRILKELPTASEVHVRAPSHPALIAMLFAPLFRTKTFWFKYAGSWVDLASRLYHLQRQWLKKLAGKNIWVTVNGAWPDLKPQILPFENPCFSEHTFKEAMGTSVTKDFSGSLDLVYVGALLEFKGVHLVIQALKELQFERIRTFHIIGTGMFMSQLKELALHSGFRDKVIFHGALPKEEVFNILNLSHALILASQTEGFPKVLSEGMLFGCVPLATEVSCIGQYVTADNGFLITDSSVPAVKLAIKRLMLDAHLEEKSRNSRSMASLFTYERHVGRVLDDIFEN